MSLHVIGEPTHYLGGDPPNRNAELTVFSLGPNEDDIVPALRLLGDFSNRQLRRFQGSLPCTMTLPNTYYAKSDTFVALLRSSGTIFEIRVWAWLCPEEEELSGRPHSCNGACKVVQTLETIR